jgi:hypothetical protein
MTWFLVADRAHCPQDTIATFSENNHGTGRRCDAGAVAAAAALVSLVKNATNQGGIGTHFDLSKTVEENNPLDLRLTGQVTDCVVEQMGMPGEHCGAESVYDNPAQAPRRLGQELDLPRPLQPVEGEKERHANEHEHQNDPRGQPNGQALSPGHRQSGIRVHGLQLYAGTGFGGTDTTGWRY